MSSHHTDRRSFLKHSSSALFAAGLSPQFSMAENQDRPNIVWITCEDLSAHFGCYGDSFARTPHVDQFAKKGIRYTHAYATAPLCTPARSSLITGIYASSLGTHHLRGVVPLSNRLKCFTEYLREAGYYCTNNVKEDYNFPTPSSAWDESSDTAHWRNKKDEQPFFSVFNFMTTHQSRTRYNTEERLKVNQTIHPQERVDPADVPIPPYYPDTPIVRENLAAFYTQITIMDNEVQNILDQLAEDGLAENTIVFFFSDHGDGLPRGKRWLHETGTHVPLIIHFPEKYQQLAPAKPGTTNHDFLNFADFAPTVLRLAGLTPPETTQGQAFLANDTYKPHEYAIAIRDRVDEVLMCSRSIRTERYRYIRNFMPHRPRMQRSFFSEQTPIRQEIRRLHKENALQGHETWLMQDSIPNDELYDLTTDPYELHNLADDPHHKSILEKHKKSLFAWMIETHDLGLMPEFEMWEQSGNQSPYDIPQDTYDVKSILPLADQVGRGANQLPVFMDALKHDDVSSRYWGATGLAALDTKAKPAAALLRETLQDRSPNVRIAAAEALCNLGYENDAVRVLEKDLLHESVLVQLHTSQCLMAIGDKAKPVVPTMKRVITQLQDEIDHGWYTRENLMFMVSEYGS